MLEKLKLRTLIEPLGLQDFEELPTVSIWIENMQIPDNVVLATLDVSSLYTNVPQEERIDVVCAITKITMSRNYLLQAIYQY